MVGSFCGWCVEGEEGVFSPETRAMAMALLLSMRPPILLVCACMMIWSSVVCGGSCARGSLKWRTALDRAEERKAATRTRRRRRGALAHEAPLCARGERPCSNLKHRPKQWRPPLSLRSCSRTSPRRRRPRQEQQQQQVAAGRRRRARAAPKTATTRTTMMASGTTAAAGATAWTASSACTGSWWRSIGSGRRRKRRPSTTSRRRRRRRRCRSRRLIARRRRR